MADQVDRLREEREAIFRRSNAVFESKDRDIERLRGLLARLEWAGNVEGSRCPVCRARPYPERDYAHDDGCELADVLGRTQKDAPPQ